MEEAVRQQLESIEKEKLIDMIIEYSEYGYFPLELFTSGAEIIVSPEDLLEQFNDAYEAARSMDYKMGAKAARLLADVSERTFEKAKKIQDETAQRNLLHTLVTELYRATEEDGIGAYWDNDWLYMDVCQKMENYLAEQNG